MKSKLALIPISIILTILLSIFLSWNEGNYLNEKIKLNNIEEATMIDSKSVDSANENKLVLLSDNIKVPEVLQDDLFGIKIENAVSLERRVYMYQWIESSEKRKDKKTVYSYRKEWSESTINSSNFNEPSHRNPQSKMYQSEYFKIDTADMGSFSIGSDFIDQMNRTESIKGLKISNNTGVKNAQVVNDEIFIGSNPASPEIGDIKIVYQYTPAALVTIVGQQVNTEIKPYKTDRGDLVELAYGDLDKDQMLALKQKENRTMMWLFRVLGIVGLWISFLMFFSPLTSLADNIPILGNIVGFGVGIVTFTLSFVLGLGIIAISWLAFRPLISVGLIIIIILLFINLNRVRRKKQGAFR